MEHLRRAISRTFSPPSLHSPSLWTLLSVIISLDHLCGGKCQASSSPFYMYLVIGYMYIVPSMAFCSAQMGPSLAPKWYLLERSRGHLCCNGPIIPVQSRQGSDLPHGKLCDWHGGSHGGASSSDRHGKWNPHDPAATAHDAAPFRQSSPEVSWMIQPARDCIWERARATQVTGTLACSLPEDSSPLAERCGGEKHCKTTVILHPLDQFPWAHARSSSPSHDCRHIHFYTYRQSTLARQAVVHR